MNIDAYNHDCTFETDMYNVVIFLK